MSSSLHINGFLVRVAADSFDQQMFTMPLLCLSQCAVLGSERSMGFAGRDLDANPGPATYYLCDFGQAP